MGHVEGSVAEAWRVDGEKASHVSTREWCMIHVHQHATAHLNSINCSNLRTHSCFNHTCWSRDARRCLVARLLCRADAQCFLLWFLLMITEAGCS